MDTSFFDHSHDLVQAIDPHGRVCYVNLSWRKALGYTAEEAAQLTIWDVIHPSQHEHCRQQLTELWTGKTAYNLATKLLTRDGRLLIVNGNLAYYSQIGQPSWVFGFFRDVTLVAQAMHNAQSYRHQLETLSHMGQLVTSSLNMEEVLQRVLDEVTGLVAAEGVAVLLLEGDELVFVAVSGPGTRGLLHTRMPAHKGVAGHVLQTGQSMNVTSRATSNVPLYEEVEKVSGFVTQTMLAVPIILEQGVIGVLEAAHSQPLPFTADTLPLLESASHWAAIAIHNAMLYEKEREQYQQLRQSQAQLVQAEKMAALGRLSSSVAHEINNPIQAIQGCVTLAVEELAQAAVPIPDEVETYLEIVQKELIRVAEIVRRLRDFYEPTADAAEAIQISSLIEEVLALMHRTIADSNITTHCQWAADLPIVWGNSNQLKQVFLNLVLNALDAMPHGGELHITAEYVKITLAGNHRTQPATRIIFRDTGEGISPEILPHLFEPFVTSKMAGSGLGLSTSYGIIQDHHGQIQVESRLGQGTTFVIDLPVG